MDVPTPINCEDIQINTLSIEKDNLLNIKGILNQIQYVDTLTPKQKQEYEKMYHGCCCCGNSQIKYICQIITLYIILLFFIICSIIFRISIIPMYNILRTQDLAKYKLYSTVYSMIDIEDIIEDNYIKTLYYNYPFPTTIFNCTYDDYYLEKCTRFQYEIENGCNFHNYFIREKCSINDYIHYCDSINYNAGYCYYYDYKVYKREYFYCDTSELNDGRCSYEHYNHYSSNDYFINYYYRRTSSSIGYIIDCGNVKFFCDFKNFENNVIIFAIILMIFAFCFIIIYINIIQKKIKIEIYNGVYFYVILFFLFLLYIIFALISILFGYLLAYSAFLTDNRMPVYYYVDIYEYSSGGYNFYYAPINYKDEELFPDEWIRLCHSLGLKFTICIFSLFFLIPIKKLILSHINLEGNEKNKKYKKTTLYIKEKKLDIEIKVDDDLIFKLDDDDKIYVFKELRIPEIKKNDNIYILMNNLYIKEQLSITDLYYYKMNIQIKRLYELINLNIVIIIFLIGLCNIFTKDKYFFEYYKDKERKTENYNNYNYYDNSYYYISIEPIYLYSILHKPCFKVYIEFEYYIEIIELIFNFIILFFYLFIFINRLLNGGIKTKSEINKYKIIIKTLIIFNWIFIILSFVLFSFALFVSIFYYILSNFNFIKLIVHSSFNLIIMILYIPIIVKNNRIKSYINQIEEEMNSINSNLKINNPINIEFFDLKKKKHTFKPFMYQKYHINLFYELNGEKINEDNEFEYRRESEVKINNDNLN